MRINKYISETGYCSRREVDDLIKTRKVTINGKVAELGSIVEEDDEVRINGRPIGEKKPKPVYIALYKPAGITSTTDRRDPTNIVDYVNHPERIFPIGRLDKDSEGLILLTNDGDIVNKILRAEGRHEKEYVVTVDKSITSSFIRGMANGVRILGTVTRKCKVERMSEYQFRIFLTEGMNRQIRRMCEVFGYDVKRLKRVRIMNITLEGLKPGQYHDLTKEELAELFDQLDYEKEYEYEVVAPKPKEKFISPYAKSVQKEAAFQNTSNPRGPKPKGPKRSKGKGPSGGGTGPRPGAGKPGGGKPGAPARGGAGSRPDGAGGKRTGASKPRGR
ncbi:MAG: 23S rRNA pseudouridine(2604) synthase RluF [Tumebacillaceae bacterium]